MQRTKEIELAGRKVLVRELRVRDVRELWALNPSSAKMEDFKSRVDALLPKVTDLKSIDDLQDFYMNEVKVLWDAIQEVNADFFDGAKTLGIGATVDLMIQTILTDLSGLSAGLFTPATASESGTTDGASS